MLFVFCAIITISITINPLPLVAQKVLLLPWEFPFPCRPPATATGLIYRLVLTDELVYC